MHDGFKIDGLARFHHPGLWFGSEGAENETNSLFLCTLFIDWGEDAGTKIQKSQIRACDSAAKLSPIHTHTYTRAPCISLLWPMGKPLPPLGNWSEKASRLFYFGNILLKSEQRKETIDLEYARVKKIELLIWTKIDRGRGPASDFRTLDFAKREKKTDQRKKKKPCLSFFLPLWQFSILST